jgi:hypothetical protein
VARLEEVVERVASERENLIENFVIGVDVRQERGRWKVDASDEAVSSASGPA